MSIAVGQLKAAYDEVPYTSHPFPLSAPENLAAVAYLFGLEAPATATARVLELGCSSGGNLVPFAARTPEAKALGIDLSSVQIGSGRKRIEALGLSNVELREADLSALDTAELGTFDYIICHGVFSWVPPQVQDGILRICRENLAADGVAYVSYNVYPGWKAKEIVRDAMMLRGGSRATPTERLSYAKGMLDFLEEVAPKESILSKTLEMTLPELRRQQDYYLAHEYLEPFNLPCYFQEFVGRAGGHGLAYLAEAQPSTMFASNYGERIAEPLLKECGHSQVVLEQYLDFIVNDPERFRKLHLAAHLPCLDGEARLDDSVQAHGIESACVTTQSPEVKAALACLSAAWPETVPYGELLRHTSEGCATAGQQAVRAKVDELLETLIIKGWARIRLSPISLSSASEPIEIDRAIRRAAALSRNEGTAMTFNAWHEPVPLGIVEAWLLTELDGTRDHAALIAALERRVHEGKIAFERSGARVVDPTGIAECIAEHVRTMSARLLRRKLRKPSRAKNQALLGDATESFGGRFTVRVSADTGWEHCSPPVPVILAGHLPRRRSLRSRLPCSRTSFILLHWSGAWR